MMNTFHPIGYAFRSLLLPPSIQPYTSFLWVGQDTSSLRYNLSKNPVRGDLYRRRKREQKCESITGEAVSVFGYRPVCRD